jgi:iron complex transport system substrate-binding protein
MPSVSSQRIVSLLPAATEILYAIGAGDRVVGVTHECDFPPEASRKPALIRPRVDPNAAPAELDRQVRELVERGQSIYAVDAELLVSLEPDLIVTQDLCHVCAASPEDLGVALSRLPGDRQPRVITFTPHNLGDVWTGVRQIGEAAGRAQEAQVLARELQARVAEVADSVAAFAAERPRVLCLEWFGPPYYAGHWVPEMVRLAGGIDILGREGEPSVAVEWDRIMDARPQVIVLMSCGYNLTRNIEVWRSTPPPAGWDDLPAVMSGRVYAVDANSYFSRSGPRLAEGTALLARLFHSANDLAALPYPNQQVAATMVQQVGVASSSA